ncbi:MAG: ASKHA domain-containing protein, partial [Anaerolineae bacterium]|nr:ASKHA domain-containing protein [Anaerolineae bacterium]
AIDELIGQAAAEAGIARERIHALSIVGNTCMHHLFLGLSPAALGRSPYVPVIAGPLQLRAAEAGLHAHPSAQLFVLPNIAGFVGADTVGVLLATRLLHKEGIRLAIDIGTNGEMVLGSRERMLACSTAAGPAFEGAQLTHGMRAAEGAIDRVDVAEDGELAIHSIGRGKLRGICGSGAVDAIAGLRRLGIVDATGRLLGRDEVSALHGDGLAERLVSHGNGGAFLLAPAEDTAVGGPILLTQRDIRQIQLAKGAIRAGIEILMKELAVGPEDVAEVCLAGAFGNYIRPESALTIGLMPRFPRAPIVPVGNAAGAGAQMALLSRQAWREAAEVKSQVEYVELSLRADFQQVFTEALTME